MCRVEVLEHTDGHLQVRYEGNIIPHRHAPPRPGVLRAISGAFGPDARDGPHREASGQPSPQPTPARTAATPRQFALWKAVQHAKIQGLSLREIERQLGVSRNTVRQ